MAIKKNELYSSLWAGCDELRGGMDASQYKDYVLTLLFVKYVSDKAKGNPYAMIEVPHGASFSDMVALKGTAALWSGKVLRAGMGAHFALHLVEQACADDLDALGVPLVATSSHTDQMLPSAPLVAISPNILA